MAKRKPATKDTSKRRTKKQPTAKGSSSLRSDKAVSVPLYPLKAENTDTIVLSEPERIFIEASIAPRKRQIVLIGRDVGYRFTGNDSDLDRLKYLVRRFVIDKNVLTWAEAEKMTFLDLIGRVCREVDREEDRRNAEWTEGLREMWKAAISHKEHWRTRCRQLVDLLREYDKSLSSGERIIEGPIPYMVPVDFEKMGLHRFRSADSRDLSWMYWILGEVMEIVFGVRGVLVPLEAREAFSDKPLSKFYKDIFVKIRDREIEHCRSYWSLIEAELEHIEKIRSEVMSWPAVNTRLREEWQNRFLWITTDSKILAYWQERERKAIAKILKYEWPKHGKARLWTFFKGTGQVYDPAKDLNDIFLAVGIKLDQLFRTETLVTRDMWSTILAKAKLSVDPIDAQSEINLRDVFGPHFEGQFMTMEPVEILWQFCAADLANNGMGDSKQRKDSADKTKWPPKGYTARGDLQKTYNVPPSTFDYWTKNQSPIANVDKITSKTSNEVAYRNGYIEELKTTHS